MAKSRRRVPQAPDGTAVAYLRVSTDEQATSGLGLEAQRTAIEAAAGRHGWRIVEWFGDEGISGAKTAAKRPGLAAALEAVRAGQARTLVVAKLDRLARNFRYAVNLIEEADDEGWDIFACDGTVDMTTPAARFQTRVMISVNELERDMIAQRTKDALAEKKARGERLGRPPALPIEVTWRIVAERAGGRTFQSIAEGLMADGVLTATGRVRWYPATVKAVVSSINASRIDEKDVAS